AVGERWPQPRTTLPPFFHASTLTCPSIVDGRKNSAQKKGKLDWRKLYGCSKDTVYQENARGGRENPMSRRLASINTNSKQNHKINCRLASLEGGHTLRCRFDRSVQASASSSPCEPRPS